MSNNKPIGYDSLQYLLKHMDPNLRFNIIRRCPSLANLDRRVTIKIHDLHVDPFRFKINDTTYTIGVIQIFRNDRTPRCIEERNDGGGFLYDVDRYGIDVAQRWNERYRPSVQRRLLSQLGRLTMVVRTPEDLQTVQESRQRRILEEMRRISIMLRRERADPPFDHYLQLTIESDRGVWIERLIYNRTIVEAKEYLLNKLFGGAERTVEVFKLHYRFDLSGNNHNRENDDEDGGFNENPHADRGHVWPVQLRNPLLPLSPGMLELHHLKVRSNIRTVIDSIQPILWDRPLKSLEANSSEMSEGIRRDPFVAAIERIIISERSTIGIIPGFLNEKVHLQCSDFWTNEVRDLVRDWQTRGLRIGRYYSIGFRHPRNIEDLLNLFKAIPGAERGEFADNRFTTFPECIILPVRDFSELNIYCEATTVEDQEFCDRPYTVKIKVQPRGYAYNLLL